VNNSWDSQAGLFQKKFLQMIRDFRCTQRVKRGAARNARDLPDAMLKLIGSFVPIQYTIRLQIPYPTGADFGRVFRPKSFERVVYLHAVRWIPCMFFVPYH
jgi:hypothetical protein